jgi:thiol-disulfide isomerase/thioredoxin
MRNYRSTSLFYSLIVLLISLSNWGNASDLPNSQAFDKAVFDQLQTQGKPVLIDVYASWCPTCERQQWTLKRYFEENPNTDLTVMVVDFDDDKQWVSYFKAPRQSTLALYQNNERIWFSVAETRKRYIFEGLNKANALKQKNSQP